MGGIKPEKILDPAGLFTEDKPAPAPAPPPVPQEATESPVPMADDEENRKAARRRVAAMKSRSGRASTILTDAGGGKLGG